MLAVASLLIAAISWSSPRWTLALLLAALPFATHHPSTAQTVLLVVLTAVFQTSYVLRTRPSPRSSWRAIATQPLLLLSSLFVAAALLSLSTLPLASIAHEHAQLFGQAHSARELALLALNWLLLSEGHREFSINAAALTLEGFVLALIVWREARASRVMAVRMAAAVVVGTAVSIGLGLLEVGGGVSLQPLRREDVGSVVLRAGTLQSVAGNPGWFSQYLVYALPYALVLLAGSSATRLRLAALTILTGVTAFALLITFQRGGWVAGTIVLFYLAIVTPGVLARDVDAGPAGRRRPWGGALYATAVILVVSALFSVWVARMNPAGEAFDRSAYLARLKSIASGDRLPYAFAGLRIASLHPVMGAGHESFAYRYGIYFDRPGGPFYRSGIRVPDPASAHDVYLQTWAGTGTVGLELLLSIFVTAAVTAIRARRAPGVGRVQLVVVTAAFGSLLGMACYGLVQEIFYVHALRLLFFVAVALIAAAGGDLVRWPPRVGFLLWTTLAATFAGHLVYEYISPGPDRLLQSGEPTGLYAEAPAFKGLRWSADQATWPVPASASRYALQVRSFAPYPQEVEMRSCGDTRTTVVLTDHAWHDLEGVLQGCGSGDHLRMQVTPTWSAPGDARTLGVVTANVRLE